jgi:hypothetical protein
MTFRPFRVRLSSSVLAFATVWQLGLAQETKCGVGVNVNSFQNFSAADQQVIVEQLKRSGVRFVRTSLRPDDKNTAKAAQESLHAWFKSTFVISHGIGLL